MSKPSSDPTAQQREAIEYGVRIGVAKAAEELDVSRGAIYQWRKRWPDLCKEEEEKWEALPQEERDAWLAHRGRPPAPAPTAVEVVTAKPKLDVAIPAGTGAAALVMALEQARAALIQARSIEELKRVADFGAVAVAYARAQDMAKEIAQEAVAVRVDALATLAEVWEATPHNPGGRTVGGSGGGVAPPPEIPTLADRGLSKDDMRVARDLLRLRRERPDLYEAARTGRMTPTGALRAQYPPERRERPAHLRALDLSLANCVLQLVAHEVRGDSDLLGMVDAALVATHAQLDAVEGTDHRALLRALTVEMVRRHPALRELAEAISRKTRN